MHRTYFDYLTDSMHKEFYRKNFKREVVKSEPNFNRFISGHRTLNTEKFEPKVKIRKLAFQCNQLHIQTLSIQGVLVKRVKHYQSQNLQKSADKIIRLQMALSMSSKIQIQKSLSLYSRQGSYLSNETWIMIKLKESKKLWPKEWSTVKQQLCKICRQVGTTSDGIISGFKSPNWDILEPKL